MAKNVGPKGVESNEKALFFQEFLMENNINVFSTESIDDEYSTVIFRSRIETRGQILPMAILINTSIFTVTRAQYKIFKYYLKDGGTVYLEACLPFIDETFDSKDGAAHAQRAGTASRCSL